jgi:hypothetical protein
MTQYMLFEAILDRTRSSWFDQHSDDEISSDTYTTSLPMIPTTGKDAEHMVEEQLPNSEKSTNPIEPRGLAAVADVDVEESYVFSRTSRD